MALRPLRLVCSPRSDVLTGGLTDNHFAAQLDKIVRDPTNYPFYGNPEEFFALTYPTSGLKALITKSFGRVTGFSGVASENGVLRSETSFGGGKTHGLTAIYHLARDLSTSSLRRLCGGRDPFHPRPWSPCWTPHCPVRSRHARAL
jgi:predicted AAA+ superfamily ATPase